MTDDVARDPADIAAAGQSEDRPKRSRRRGRRSKNKAAEGQSAPAQAAVENGQKPAGEPAKAAPSRGSRKTGGQKSGYVPFNDGLDRFVCLECFRFLPLTYPVQHRRGTATVPIREVDRRAGELLLCNGLHDGPCLWPDGEIVDTAASAAPPEAVEVVATADERAREPTADEAPEPESDVEAMQLTESR